MYQRCSHQPWHEGSVLDRIPEPPAAPTEFVVSPPTSERDAARQKHPRHGGPWPRPARPGCVELTADQRGDREGKRNGETDVAHVKHRWMSHHRRILQQWIEVATVEGHWEQA